MTFCDTDKKFELQDNLLKMITSRNFNVDLANVPHKNLMYEFAKEMYFDEKALDNKTTRDKSNKRLFHSTAIIAGFLKESKTRFISSSPNELCDN